MAGLLKFFCAFDGSEARAASVREKRPSGTVARTNPAAVCLRRTYKKPRFHRMFLYSLDLSADIVSQIWRMPAIDALNVDKRTARRIDAALRTHFLKWIAAFFVVL
jgi:hypothetical protein